MIKAMKISFALQLLYCIGCGIVLVCMPLYTLFYPTAFSGICFKVGATMTFVSALKPVGIVCGIINIVSYISERQMANNDQQIKKMSLVWVIMGPILTTLCWLLAILSFVFHSGGV